MTLELHRRPDGTGFQISVIGIVKRVEIPLSQELSGVIAKMLQEEAIAPGGVALPPGFARQ